MILGLLAAVAALATVAHRLKVPYPILLVLGGLVLGFVPGLPQVELKPELVFLLFLPPLLYVSPLFSSSARASCCVRLDHSLGDALLESLVQVKTPLHGIAGAPKAHLFRLDVAAL